MSFPSIMSMGSTLRVNPSVRPSSHCCWTIFQPQNSKGHLMPQENDMHDMSSISKWHVSRKGSV